MTTKRIVLFAALLPFFALAGCATTFTPVNECPLLGVATGAPDCFVDYYGSGGDQGDSGDSDSGDSDSGDSDSGDSDSGDSDSGDE